MIGEHLTLGQVEDYAAKRLPAEQIPAFFDHAETCSACREMLVATVTGGDEHVSEHVSERQAVDFVAELLSVDEKRRVGGHLEICAVCAAMVGDIADFRRSVPAPVTIQHARRRTIAWVLPIAAALFAVAGVSVWLNERHRGDLLHDLTLRDAAGTWQLDSAGKLIASTALPRGAADLMATALRTGHLPLGPAALFIEKQDTLRSSASGGAAPELKILSPNGVRMISDRPEFRWTPVKGASSYQVTVTDEDLNEVARSGPIHGLTEHDVGLTEHDVVWIPETPLPRLRTMLWQVTAIRNGGRITAPAPPEPSPRFEIVSADTARQIEEIRAARPPSHLLLAVLYAQAGLSREAASETDAITALNPGSALASSLRESLAARP